ncbi:tyrosine 2,3-aminomutase [Candidatus Cardinium hertigii]|uniref:tyrosine 2,3-aminomutase n=1 Tax=Candidatus Cardinium hertigii TaxID=247481 RepID=UPI003D7E8662
MNKVIIDGSNLSIDEVYAIAHERREIRLADHAVSNILDSRQFLELLIANGIPIYGVTTGYGEMVSILIDKKYETELQHNLIRSHAAGIAPFFSKEESRAILLARINSLAKGYSAITKSFIDRLIFYLNHDIIPVIPEIGSLGASGDLAPLAHLALTLIGEGSIFGADGQPMPTRDKLTELGIKPLDFKFKEGLATINGTSAMTGLAALLIYDAFIQIKTAEIIAALVLENQKALNSPFSPQGNNIARPHQGQIDTAFNITNLIDGSRLITNHETLCSNLLEQKNGAVTLTNVYLQKAYTLRCIPQIVGAIRDTLYHAQKIVTIELNSANDNPLFFKDNQVFHGGNFHGQPIAFAMDFLAIALTQLGVLSERRTNRLLNKQLNSGLTPFLVKNQPGLHCGLAGTQYPATALVAENRLTSTPASIQSIPSNADNQDVVSMGLIAARNARKILNNNTYILAIELISAAQAIDVAGQIELLSTPGKTIHRLVRSSVSCLEADRYMSEDINKIASLIKTGQLIEALASIHIKLR